MKVEPPFCHFLQTPRLTLRPPSPGDLAAFQSWCGNADNVRWMSFGPNDENQTLAWITQAKLGKDFAVVLKETGRVFGSCGVYPDEKMDTGVMGWILHKDYWKCGYGTEIVAELLRYSFQELKLRRVWAFCAVENYGSLRVMERNGMRREALQIKAYWAHIDKKWVDRAEYAMLAEEFLK